MSSSLYGLDTKRGSIEYGKLSKINPRKQFMSSTDLIKGESKFKERNFYQNINHESTSIETPLLKKKSSMFKG